VTCEAVRSTKATLAMHGRKRLLASIALVGVMLVTLACSHGESTGDLLNGGQKTGSAGQQAATATPRSPKGSDGPAASASATGGTLRLVGGLPPTLDPAMAQDSTSAEYIVHLFSGLVRLNGDLVVIPDLAANWTVSDDGRVYTFTLRDDARFADGRALTSADVVYSIERACSPATGSPVAASYLSDIVGVPEYATGAAASIDGLRAPSPRTVELTIDAPKAYFLAKLTYTASFVVDREQIEADSDGWMRQPNGSGPFVLAEMSQEHIVLERNENYYGTRPALDRVEYIVAGGFPVTMYENDELDIVDVPPSEM